MGYLYICYSCSDFMATCMVEDFFVSVMVVALLMVAKL